MPTRAECQAQIDAALAEYAALLGLVGRWRLRARFGRSDQDSDLKDRFAAVRIYTATNEAEVLIDDLVKPEHYRREVAHECLHVFFDTLDTGIAALKQPGKAVLYQTLHRAIATLSEVLSGDQTSTEALAGERPPWDAPLDVATQEPASP